MQIFGGILSHDPLITLGKRRHLSGEPLGLLSHNPDFFRDRPSLNFLMLAWSHELPDFLADLETSLAAAQSDFPLAKFVILANTEREREIIEEKGISAINGNLLLFSDEDLYKPEPVPDTPFDAVYVGGFGAYKRHALAAEIERLMLLYWRPTDEQYAAMKSLLPNAHFQNHATPDGSFRLIRPPEYCAQLCRAKVGVCLSRYEGPMRASMEYALCGLPVVSTESIGGRTEILNERHFARIVSDDPAEIAQAVREMAAENYPPDQIRAEAIAQLEKLRSRFLDAANTVVQRHFGPQTPEFGLPEFQACGPHRTRDISRVFP